MRAARHFSLDVWLAAVLGAALAFACGGDGEGDGGSGSGGRPPSTGSTTSRS